jgi:O-antigen ligase
MSEYNITPAGGNASHRLWLTVCGIGIALLFGLLAAVIPPIWLIAAVIAVLFLTISFSHTYVALILAMAVMCGVGDQFFPGLAVGSGSLRPHEIMMLPVLLGTLNGYFRINRSEIVAARWRDLWVCWFIMLLFIMGSINGYLFGGASAKTVLQEMRVHLMWIVFPITYLVCLRENLCERFMRGIYWLGVILSLAVATQYLSGVKILSRSRFEALNTLNEVNPEATRVILGGGLYFVCLSLLLLIAQVYIDRRSNPMRIAFVPVLVFSVIVSYGRAVWAALFLSVLLLTFLCRGFKGAMLYVMVAICAVLVSALIGDLLAPDFFNAILERILSIKDEGFKNSSLGWRVEEINYAVDAISKHPIFGLGLGTYYKPVIPLGDEVTTELMRRYIHNSFFGLWLKFGFLGPVFMASFLISCFIAAKEVFKRASGVIDPQFAAISCSVLVPLLASFTQPEWLSDAGISFFSVSIGVVTAFAARSKSKTGST